MKESEKQQRVSAERKGGKHQEKAQTQEEGGGEDKVSRVRMRSKESVAERERERLDLAHPHSVFCGKARHEEDGVAIVHVNGTIEPSLVHTEEIVEVTFLAEELLVVCVMAHIFLSTCH